MAMVGMVMVMVGMGVSDIMSAAPVAAADKEHVSTKPIRIARSEHRGAE